MVPERQLEIGEYRLLEVDHRAVLPYNVETMVITNSADVLHAWTLPAIGVKLDAVPGRLNRARLLIQKPGIYYGQCSEICGANHSFMPIVVEAIGISDFIDLVIDSPASISLYVYLPSKRPEAQAGDRKG